MCWGEKGMEQCAGGEKGMEQCAGVRTEWSNVLG